MSPRAKRSKLYAPDKENEVTDYVVPVFRGRCVCFTVILVSSYSIPMTFTSHLLFNVFCDCHPMTRTMSHYSREKFYILLLWD